MSEQDARLALEQLVRTAQAVGGRGSVPVDVLLERQITDTDPRRADDRRR